jgi:hypothetical protein
VHIRFDSTANRPWHLCSNPGISDVSRLQDFLHFTHSTSSITAETRARSQVLCVTFQETALLIAVGIWPGHVTCTSGKGRPRGLLLHGEESNKQGVHHSEKYQRLVSRFMLSKVNHVSMTLSSSFSGSKVWSDSRVQTAINFAVQSAQAMWWDIDSARPHIIVLILPLMSNTLVKLLGEKQCGPL